MKYFHPRHVCSTSVLPLIRMNLNGSSHVLLFDQYRAQAIQQEIGEVTNVFLFPLCLKTKENPLHACSFSTFCVSYSMKQAPFNGIWAGVVLPGLGTAPKTSSAEQSPSELSVQFIANTASWKDSRYLVPTLLVLIQSYARLNGAWYLSTVPLSRPSFHTAVPFAPLMIPSFPLKYMPCLMDLYEVRWTQVDMRPHILNSDPDIFCELVSEKWCCTKICRIVYHMHYWTAVNENGINLYSMIGSLFWCADRQLESTRCRWHLVTNHENLLSSFLRCTKCFLKLWTICSFQ